MNTQIKYVTDAYSKTGTVFKDTTLEATLNHCLTLPKNGKKGNYGSIFIYNSTQLGIHTNDVHSTGVILLDIDYISKETADTIYKGFEYLYNFWPALLAIQYSSSYYISDSKNGLHIYIRSKELDSDEYKQQSQICLAIFAELVSKYLEIDLHKDNKTLDFHNTNLYQRFNLFYSTFKYNNFCKEFDINSISFNDLENLVIKYNLDLDTEVYKVIAPTINNVKINVDKSERIKIDRNFRIGSYRGNDIRFRISIIADKLFGDNAQAFCDKYFYFENGKSIYTHYSSGNIINPLIYKWLVDNQYIIESSQNFINNWLDEYTDEIVKEINNNRRLEIIAPTGSGKTTFINDFLAHHFNSVVIVPFNVTNKLYDNLFEVNSTYSKDVPKNKPVVMVWDQAIRRWNEIKDRHIIIDEAHTLFFDRNYRNVAVQLIIKLKEDNCWFTFITATPAGEKDIFNMNQLVYHKKRNDIQLNIKATENIEWSQYNYIKKCLENGWYDRIVLLDDISAKKIYEKFVIDCYGDEISYIRSSTKESKDFIELRDSELLKKKLTICTCVAFNGLNFKNENEKILVVGSIQLGQTTSCEIIQQIGRIRNSKVTGLYFFNANKVYEEDIDRKQERAEEFNKIYSSGCNETFLSYDRRYLNEDFVNALRNIQEYQTKHSNIDTIINELGNTGYIKGKVEDKIKKESNHIKMTLALKRKESNELKEDIINDDFLYRDYESEYKSRWAKDIRYLLTNPYYSGITLDMFIELFNNEYKQKLIETSINNIKDIIRYVGISDNEVNNVIYNKDKFMMILSNEVDRRDFANNIKRIIKIRNQYKDKIKINDNGCIDLSNVIADVIEWEEENMKTIKQLKSDNGKKGKKHILDILTGIEYESCKDCAKNIGKSTAYVSKYKNRFKIL